ALEAGAGGAEHVAYGGADTGAVEHERGARPRRGRGPLANVSNLRGVVHAKRQSFEQPQVIAPIPSKLSLVGLEFERQVKERALLHNGESGEILHLTKVQAAPPSATRQPALMLTMLTPGVEVRAVRRGLLRRNDRQRLRWCRRRRNAVAGLAAALAAQDEGLRH